MGLDRETLAQLRHLLRPIVARIANTVARGVVELVGDGDGGQTLQVSVLDGEVLDDAEHVQPYGLSSVPLTGAECAVIFPGGDRSHPLVVSVADSRHRPTGAEPGTVTLYNAAGAKVTLLPSGDIEVQPASGREVIVSTGGATDRLVKASEFAGHTHAAGTLAAPNGSVTGATAGAAAVSGTSTLRAQ